MNRSPFPVTVAARRLGRFAALHPALWLGLALVARGIAVEIELPPEPAETVEVTGVIRTLPELDEGRLRFELEPDTLFAAGRELRPAGRVLVSIGGGDGRPDQGFDPPLLPGERVRFRSSLEEPSWHAVPAVPDFRRESRARGLYWRATLKSPLQLERLGPAPGPKAAVLRLASWYVNGFRTFLNRELEPSQRGWIEALLLALQGGVPAERWEEAAEVGLVHLLVVSGLHVGLIAGAAHNVFRGLGSAAVLPVWMLVGIYVAVIGLPPPATRAALMIGGAYLARTVGLRARPLNLLGLAASAILLDRPELAQSRSFQFTFASVGALVLLGAPAWRRVWILVRGIEAVGAGDCDVRLEPGHRAGRWIRFHLESAGGFLPGLLPWVRRAARPLGGLGSLGISSAAVALGTLPLALFHTNLFPVWSVPANVVVLPVFSFLAPLAFATLLFYWTAAGRLLAPALAAVLQVFEGLLDWMQNWDGGVWVRAPGPGAAAAYLLAVAVAVLLPRWWKSIVLLLPAVLLVWLARPGPVLPELQLTMLDVGQGDAIHLRYPDGRHALVDTGGSRFDPFNRRLARRVLARYLLDQGARSLEFVLVTHPESDHMGSLAALGRVLPVKRLLFYSPPPVMGGEPVRVQQDVRWSLAGVEHVVLHPAADSDAAGSNDRSVVLLIRHGSHSVLLTGDVGRRVEAGLGDRLSPVTVLKVAHHGSNTSTSRGFLAAVHPAVALISAGRRNAFGHPSGKVTDRLEEQGVAWWATATSGSLRWSTDGRNWRLSRYDPQRRHFIPLARNQNP